MFLYELKLLFSNALAVLIRYMISEKHDKETIRQWLTRWKLGIRSQVHEFVIYQSLTLMAAAVLTFTQFNNLQP